MMMAAPAFSTNKYLHFLFSQMIHKCNPYNCYTWVFHLCAPRPCSPCLFEPKLCGVYTKCIQFDPEPKKSPGLVCRIGLEANDGE